MPRPHELTSAIPLLHDYLIEASRMLPDKKALVVGGVGYTYAEIDRQARGV